MEFFFDSPILILATASALGLFMAWGIGANDVANAMGTSVGSKAITLKPVSYTHLRAHET